MIGEWCLRHRGSPPVSPNVPAKQSTASCQSAGHFGLSIYATG
jgi:hypothetical protein